MKLSPDRIELTPTDTLFCFGKQKSKYILKRLSHASYCDSIVSAMEDKSAVQDSIIENQEDIIVLQNKEKVNYEKIISDQKDEIKRLRIREIIVGAVAVIVVIISAYH